MPIITPIIFWELYREAMRAALQMPGSWQAYQRDKTWTPIAVGVAKAVCQRSLGLETEKEYFRIDLIGFESKRAGDWHLRVAYEHENRDSWHTELCKLTHVVADLCVLSSYYDFHKDQPLENALQVIINRLEDRIERVPARQWLFIFGPRSACAEKPFVALGLNETRQVVVLPDGNPLFVRPRA